MYLVDWSEPNISFVKTDFYDNWQLSKFPRADCLVVVEYKSTDNKNDARCNQRASSTENKANSARTFSML